MNEANETYRAASAIAAFDAIQVAFAALVKKAILSKAEAEQILMQAIETIKTGGAGDQAAELLAIALEKISKFEPTSPPSESALDLADFQSRHGEAPRLRSLNVKTAR